MIQLRIFFEVKNSGWRASLVVQCLRIHLPMQGTQVRSLVREDPTCHGATKPVHHNYWACTLEPVSHNYWACVPQLLSLHAATTEAHAPRAHAPQREATAMRSPRTTTKSSPHSPQTEKSPCAATKTQSSQKKIIIYNKINLLKKTVQVICHHFIFRDLHHLTFFEITGRGSSSSSQQSKGDWLTRDSQRACRP